MKTYDYNIKEPVTEEEFLLTDRIQKIRQIISMYGEKNFYISFSGGKDSTVLSALIDMALPGNSIPRVFCDTGMELNMMKEFVYGLAKKDARVVILKPAVPVIPSLERDGYPFKSKPYAHHVERYNRIGMVPSVKSYLGQGTWGPMMQCPKMLRYQFTPEFKERLKVSDRCCVNLKEKPMQKWAQENARSIAILGIMPDEGGRRINSKCLAFNGNKIKAFQPLTVLTKSWEDWYIKEYDIEICPLYLPPYNFERTGCKGCPFALNLQHELDMLEKYFPAERAQCEIVWKPVYAEYRRIGFRLAPTKEEISGSDAA